VITKPNPITSIISIYKPGNNNIPLFIIFIHFCYILLQFWINIKENWQNKPRKFIVI